MDPTTESLSDYACRLIYEDLSPEAIELVERTLVESSECAVGGFDGEPSSRRKTLDRSFAPRID